MEGRKMAAKKRAPGSVRQAPDIVRSSAVEYLTFVAASGEGGVEAVYADENVWLTQKMMAVLYDVSIPNISMHLKKVFNDSELVEESVVKDFLTTAADGKRYHTQFYNLAAIIAVGYKVNSEKAVQFRKWATRVLEEYDAIYQSDFDRFLELESQLGDVEAFTTEDEATAFAASLAQDPNLAQ